MKLGIDLGGSHIAIGLVSEEGKLLIKKQRDILQKEQENIQTFIINTILQLIDEIFKESGLNIEFISKIGIATPGIFKDGCIQNAVNLKIKELEISSKIQDRYPISIVGDNDVNCCAIAEQRLGSLKTVQDSFFLAIGTGIGGAYIYNNNIVKPRKYPGFEVGHMVIEKDGKLCNCGNHGCFETYCSIKRLRQTVRQALGLTESVRGREIVEHIEMELSKSNKRIEHIIEEYTDYLSLGISNIFNLFEPEVISIGGSFVHYSKFLLPRVKIKMQEKNMLFHPKKEVNIVLATLGNNAGIIGASLL